MLTENLIRSLKVSKMINFHTFNVAINDDIASFHLSSKDFNDSEVSVRIVNNLLVIEAYKNEMFWKSELIIPGKQFNRLRSSHIKKDTLKIFLTE